MRNRTITISLFCIVLLFFTVYFVVFYSILPSGEPIKSQLQSLIDYADMGKWEEAGSTLEDLDATWSRIRHLLAINYGEADYSIFLEFLGRLKTSVRLREASQVATDAAAALELWKNFTRVIPEP